MVETSLANAVRQATIRDVHAIRRLEEIVFPRDAYSYLSLADLLTWPGGSNYKATDLRGKLIGFAAGSPNYGTHTDWIVTLGVHPDYQRQGLGYRLLTACEGHMSQPTLALTVRASNAPAIRLYESAGYQYTNVEPSYYNDGEDGIVMQKKRYP